jgi:hypothetical protein
MPYFVESTTLPSVMTLPNGAPSPQLLQFVSQLTANLNGLEQRGLHLDQVIPAGQVTLLVFKQ